MADQKPIPPKLIAFAENLPQHAADALFDAAGPFMAPPPPGTSAEDAEIHTIAAAFKRAYKEQLQDARGRNWEQIIGTWDRIIDEASRWHAGNCTST